MQQTLPNELQIKQAIADRTRELRTLKAISRALERYRRDHNLAIETRHKIAQTICKDNEVVHAD